MCVRYACVCTTWHVDLDALQNGFVRMCGKYTELDWLMPFRGNALSIFTLHGLQWCKELPFIRRKLSKQTVNFDFLCVCAFFALWSTAVLVTAATAVVVATTSTMSVMVCYNKIQTIICFNSELIRNEHTFYRLARACFYFYLYFIVCCRLFAIHCCACDESIVGSIEGVDVFGSR